MPSNPQKKLENKDQDLLKLLYAIKHDFIFYAENCLHIKTKAGDLIPFKLNRAQRVMWENYLLPDIKQGKPIRYIILKARQLGITTLIQAIIYWYITLNKNRAAITIAQSQDAVENIFDKQKIFYKTMPDSLRPMRKISNRKELLFANPDDTGVLGLESRVLVQTAENPELGRSFTFQCAHLSEFGFWEGLGFEPKKRMVALNQSIPDLPGTFVFIETTAQGDGYFKSVWDDLENTYRKIFISWIAEDTYRIELNALEYFQLQDVDDGQYGNEVEEFENIKEQVIYWFPEWDINTIQGAECIDHEVMCRLAWRRKMIKDKCENDIFTFQQEYPTNPEQAFISSGSGVFDSRALSVMRKSVKQGKSFRYNNNVEEIIDLFGRKDPLSCVREAFFQHPHGHLKIYDPPHDDNYYVIGVDTSEGITGGDPSALVVLHCPDLIEVASLSAIIQPADLAYQTYCLGMLYNKALVGVEINDRGSTAVLNVLQRRLFYRNLYWREVFDTVDITRKEKRYGWKTTSITKPIMVSDCRALIKAGEIELNNLETIGQFGKYKKFSDGRMGVNAPSHDDLAVATMIAVQMARQIHIQIDREKNTTKKFSLKWWENLIDSFNPDSPKYRSKRFSD